MSVTLLISVIVTFAIPAVAIYLILTFDLFGTRDRRVIALCLAWGGVGAFLLANVTLTALMRTGVAYITVVTLVAPILEEIFKALALVYLVRRPEFHYVVDGAVYGFAVGVGFGVAETVAIYLPNNPNAALVSAISRSLSTILMHAGASALVGASIGRLRRASAVRSASVWTAFGVALAVAAHFTYNNMAYRLESNAQVLLLFGVGFGLLSVVVIGLLIRQGIVREKASFSDVLTPEVGVSVGERRAVQQLGSVAIEQVFGNLGQTHAFEDENIGLLRRALVLQAHIGIRRNSVAHTADDRLRAVWEAEIADLRTQIDAIRKELLERQVWRYLVQVFHADDPAMQRLLEEEFARTDPSLVNTFDMFMRVSELAETLEPEQLDARAHHLHALDIFRAVEDIEELKVLGRAVEPVAFEDGTLLFDKGDAGDAMYVVQEGAIEIYTRTEDGREMLQRTFRADDVSVVGEFALLDGGPRSTPARARGKTETLALQRQVFLMFISSRPHVMLAILKFLAGKLRHTTEIAQSRAGAPVADSPRPAVPLTPASAQAGVSAALRLKQSALFERVELPILEELVGVMRPRSFVGGDVLFEKDKPETDQLKDALCFILSGRIRIYLPDDQGGETTFRRYGENEIVGEVSLFDQGARSASGMAEGPLEVLALHRDDWLKFLELHRSVGLAMIRSLTERIRYTQSFLESMGG